MGFCRMTPLRDDLSMSLDDDSIEINLRRPDEIGRRLVALGAVLTRVGLESNAPVGGAAEDIADAEEERFDLLAWLRSEIVIDSLSLSERALLEAPVGSLPFETVAGFSWQAERFAVVAWTTSLVDALPDIHQEADINAPLAVVPTPWDNVSGFTATLELRTDEELAAELERAEIWLWRAETEEARRIASRDELAEIAEAIAEVVAEGVETGLLERAPDGDFFVGGKSFHRLSEDARARIAVIASERLRALNWLRGAEDDWDNLSAEF